jgi:hypothetical protein
MMLFTCTLAGYEPILKKQAPYAENEDGSNH